VYGSRQLQ
jgi:hypothetical protein